MSRASRSRQRPFLLLSGCALAVGSGCFTDAFRGPEYHGELGATRFELVIESDRTAVEGSHFLLDRATGDLWVLDARPGGAGGWRRISEGPADAKPFALPGRGPQDAASAEGGADA